MNDNQNQSTTTNTETKTKSTSEQLGEAATQIGNQIEKDLGKYPFFLVFILNLNYN